MIQEYLNSLENFIVVGDRVLLKPRDMETHMRSGLVLPASVKEKEEIQSGYILKTGPGYPIPNMEAEEECKTSKGADVMSLMHKQVIGMPFLTSCEVLDRKKTLINRFQVSFSF